MRSRHTRLFAGTDREGRPSSGWSMSRAPFDPEIIRALATILAETGLTEIEISDKDSRVKIARTPAPVSASVPVHAGPAPATPALPPPPGRDRSGDGRRASGGRA